MIFEACPSWDHGTTDIPVVPGHITCAQHRGQELRILKVRDDLCRLGAEIRAYEDEPERHPDEAKEFLESAVRWFFNQELQPHGVVCSSAFRSALQGRQQLDVVVALHIDGPRAWSVDMRVLRHAEQATLAMHTEIAYRGKTSSDLNQKVKSDGRKLLESIGQACARGKGLPWTSLVLLGDAWRDPTRTEGVMKQLHDLVADDDTHGGGILRVESGGRPWWPIIDAVVMPTVVYKKHDLFESEAAALRRASDDVRWPCWMSFPADLSDPFRSLAIARAYLVHRVRLLQSSSDEMPDEGRAWPLEEAAAIVGPVQALRGHPEAGRTFLARDPDRDMTLWHAGFDRAGNRYVAMPVTLKRSANPKRKPQRRSAAKQRGTKGNPATPSKRSAKPKRSGGRKPLIRRQRREKLR